MKGTEVLKNKNNLSPKIKRVRCDFCICRECEYQGMNQDITAKEHRLVIIPQ